MINLMMCFNCRSRNVVMGARYFYCSDCFSFDVEAE